MPRYLERRVAQTSLVLATVLLGALAGCTAPQKPLEHCEPGVNELSNTANVLPGNC
ncbi:MAG: hypothetical protein ACK40I_07245 [Tabrizicola sp.]